MTLAAPNTTLISIPTVLKVASLQFVNVSFVLRIVVHQIAVIVIATVKHIHKVVLFKVQLVLLFNFLCDINQVVQLKMIEVFSGFLAQ